jgi:pimeloyl-ACP methyl ester carboxylesterase
VNGGKQRSPVVTAAVVAIVGVAAAACGLAALLGAAALTALPVVFVGAGLVTFLALDGAGVLLAVRGRRRRVRWLVAGATSLPLAALFVVSALVPPGADVAPDGGLPGERVVRVATGSSLAVVEIPARPRPGGPPVVVLHGGPGVPDLAANARVFAPLASEGFDVYLYAQAGTGDSIRLADPRGYGRDRDVADLEALRRRLGLDRMALICHSYGGGLAAAYAAQHPDRVAAMVLISPAPLDPADQSPTRATAGLSPAQRFGLYAAVLTPRALLGYGLLQIHPEAAHAYLPDRWADAINDEAVQRAQPALHCPGAVPGWVGPVRGTGFYAMQFPQSATAPPPTDPRPALTGLPIPTTIIKGSCDYLSWHSAIDYRRRLPAAHLLYLPGAGHNAQQDRPKIVRAAVLALLRGGPPPVRSYKGDGVPAGYRGPP